jgi:anti-anti-sigma regulatory factor
MLKITTQKNAGGTILELEGRLAGPWVQELERCWRRAVGMDQPVRVMLKAVTFIDDRGRRLLAEMHQRGASLVAEGCMTKAIVEDIVRRGRV